MNIITKHRLNSRMVIAKFRLAKGMYDVGLLSNEDMASIAEQSAAYIEREREWIDSLPK